MAFDAGKGAGEDEAAGTAVFMRVDVAWKGIHLAKIVFRQVRRSTNHMEHRELRSGSGMIARRYLEL